MDTWKHQALLDQVLHAIERDDLALPTLPEVALKMHDLIKNPNASSNQIIEAVSGDPFIAAQLIKAANGAAFADKPPVYNVRVAISRLGFRQLHDLLINITMNKMFFSNNPILNRRMKTVWEHSREVAATSYVLASHHAHLSPDQAMLAGLIHEIGVLPLCLHIEKTHEQINEETLNELIQKCHSTIGSRLLKKWNFPQGLIDVVAEHENLSRDPGNMSRADYTDVVSIANLQNGTSAGMVAWGEIAAAKRLKLSAEECRIFPEHHAGRIASVKGMLGITPNPEIRGISSAPLPSHKQTLELHPEQIIAAPNKKGGWSSFLPSIFNDR
ncbi:MAG: HDOD domain-containing protein [Gallionellaceae bacterium]|jgi:HD-like signal output (HDOD) protein